MFDKSSTDDTSKLVKSLSNAQASKNIQLISVAIDVDQKLRSPLKLFSCMRRLHSISWYAGKVNDLQNLEKRTLMLKKT